MGNLPHVSPSITVWISYAPPHSHQIHKFMALHCYFQYCSSVSMCVHKHMWLWFYFLSRVIIIIIIVTMSLQHAHAFMQPTMPDDWRHTTLYHIYLAVCDFTYSNVISFSPNGATHKHTTNHINNHNNNNNSKNKNVDKTRLKTHMCFVLCVCVCMRWRRREQRENIKQKINVEKKNSNNETLYICIYAHNV